MKCDGVDRNCVMPCGLLKPVIRKRPKSNSVLASHPVYQALALPAQAGNGLSLCPGLIGATLFTDPQLVVN